MNTQEAKVVIETALLCAKEPIELSKLKRLFNGYIGCDTIRFLLEELRIDWQTKGLELTVLASGWRFQSRDCMSIYLERLNLERSPKYSRAVMETLAIITYRQPVTRGDIEDIRGVGVNTQILRQLEERGWIEVIGQREVAGRPSLYATTKKFLDDIGLKSLVDLPQLADFSESLQQVASI